VNVRSIGFRLSAWYFLVFAVGITLFSVLAWFAMRASLFNAIDDELQDRVTGVQKFMEEQIASLSVPEIRDEFREHSVLGPGGDLFQVADNEGQWLYRSLPLENNSVAIQPVARLLSPVFEVRTIQSRPLRLYTAPVGVRGKRYAVQVAAPLSESLEALQSFRTALLLVTPILLVGASLGGYWISRRALKPVDQISRTATRISIENLKDRLDVPATGDELQRLSETLNAMLARLDGSVERMKQFTADASHELRAPVSLIRTTAEVAILRDRTMPEYREALIEILQESERTTRLVDSLMLLARADAGQQLELVEADAVAIIHEAAEQGKRLAGSRGIPFTASCPEYPVRIMADPDAMRRALLILIDNAVKYTPEGGHVEMRLVVDNRIAVMEVSDTGMGIASEDLPHVFDRFWRADKARSRERGGAGLGLSIARWIVSAHAGEIRAVSGAGKGAAFEIRVPLRG
jgi:heavy metal sensor kinase